MRSRHGEDEIGARRDPGSELSSAEVGGVTAQVLQHEHGILVDRVADHGARSSTARLDRCELAAKAVGRCESLGCRRPADVRGAYEQDLQAAPPHGFDDLRIPGAGGAYRCRLRLSTLLASMKCATCSIEWPK
jgi:hypothetical protein